MTLYQALFNLFENYIKNQPERSEPVELFEPIDYILHLGGKRMRPILTLMGCDLFGGKVEEALPVAYAMELFHNFTLMHDDIMDHAPLRRGNQTVHERYGVNRAILSGDVMLIGVYEVLRKVDGNKFHRIFEVFNNTASQVCQGQQYDMNFQTQRNVSVEDYLKMIEYKTAVLLACCLQCGAIMAGADKRNSELTYEFGRNIGLCFQLMDDLLDAFGDKEKLGKKIGGDIEENKRTYLLIKALELAEGKTKQELEFYLQNNVPHDEKIAGIKAVFIQLNIKDQTKQLIDHYHDEAIKSLEVIETDAAKKTVLKEYAEKLLNRDY